MSSQPDPAVPDPTGDPGPVTEEVRRPRRRIRPFLLIALTFICIWVVSGLVLVLNPTVLAAMSAIWLKPQQGVVPWNGHDRITIVAMGLTQRTTEPARTDSLLVMDINPAAREISMLSVPRDLWVQFPDDYGQGKLAIPYAIGGAKLTAYTLEKALGIPVDYTIAMKFRGFMHLVDAMGGVDVNVPQELNDPTYPCLTGADYCPIDIRKGPQHMDGATALEFVRERHAFALQDLARVQDQQAFSEAVKQTLISPKTWPRFPSILNVLKSALITNMPLNDLPVLGADMLLASGSRTHHYYINTSNGMVKPAVSSDGQDILLPTNSTVIPNLVHRLFGDPMLGQENASVEVLNGTTTSGIAVDLQSTLQGLGFNTVGAGDATTSNYARDTVIVNSAARGPAEYTARRLQRILDARIVHESVSGQTARIVVVIGKNFPLA